MTGLACWLVIVAGVDLFRARRDVASMFRRAVLGGGGAVAVLIVAVTARPIDAWGWVAWCVGALLLVGWVFSSGRALSEARSEERSEERRGRDRAAALAYGALGLGVLVLGLAGTRTGQLGWLHHVLRHSIIATADPEHVLTAAAVLLLQVSTANIVIRMLLDLVGVPAQDNEKTLRGGRVLGPMERVVIVGLGLAGSLTGATVVVAAKALLRFPDLRPTRAQPQGGASDVTEYFLIGSFASWIVAFGCVALASV